MVVRPFYVRHRPPKNTSLIRADGLEQRSLSDPPGVAGGGAVTTAAVPPLIETQRFGVPTFTSSVVGGYVIPDRHTSSDPMVKITPYTSGDKRSVADSTAGIQAFLDNETPSGATVILPFDVRVDGTLQLKDGRTLRSPDINNKKRIFRALIWPWRVVPDLRATVNSAPNPWYNPNGRCSQWQYDWRGGQNNAFAADPNDSTTNPYGRNPTTGAAKGSGDDVGGFDVYDEAWFVAPDASGHAVANPAYDGKHLTALPPVTIAGKVWAGYPAGAIWFAGDVGKRLRVVTYTAGSFQKTITSVDAGGRTVRWADNTGVGKSLYVNMTLQWCINEFNGAGWIVQMISNPGYAPIYYNGTTRPGGRSDHYDTAMLKCYDKNQNPIINMAAGTSLIGIEVINTNIVGGQAQSVIPNEHDAPCRNALLNWNTSKPLAMEFAHSVSTDGSTPPTCRIDHCSIHHTFGDAQVGNVILTNSRLSGTGRQGMTLYWSGIRVDNCVFEDHKHSNFDLESPGDVTNDVQFTNNCIGGPHGGSVSSVVNNFVYTGNHSTAADIAAGRISSLSGPTRSGNWGRGVEGNVGGQNWTISNNTFENGAAEPSWKLIAVNGLTMRNNIGPTITQKADYYLQPEYVVGNPAGRCTNMTLSGNDGGPLMIGTGGNNSITPT